MMPTRRPIPSLVCSLLVAAVGGCSSSSTDPKPPVVDALTMSDQATVSADGVPQDYDVTGTISYHDPDGVVAKIRVYTASSTDEIQLAAVRASVENAKVTFIFHSGVAGATFDYEVTVIDNDGLESNRSDKQTVHIP